MPRRPASLRSAPRRPASLRTGFGATRSRRVLVVYCHPSSTSLVSAAKDRVLAALTSRHTEHRLIDLYGDGFTPELSSAERVAHLSPGTDTSIADHAAALQWCDTLVFVYPTWWAGQPAMLKGWFDRVWVNGVAWELPAGSHRLRPRLSNVRRIVAVTTHGSPKYVNAVEGEGGKRTITRSLRVMCHPLCRTTWLALYNVDRADQTQRSAFLDRVERVLGSLLA